MTKDTVETQEKSLNEEETGTDNESSETLSESPEENEEFPSPEESETAVAEEEISPEVQLQKRVEELEGLLEQSDEKQKRLLAEFENFKRRNRQENESRLKFAQQPLALSIIPGLDNLERAIEHAVDEQDEKTQEFIKGVDIVYQEFVSALAKQNIKRIEPKGETFDPNKHEAVGVVETDDIEPEHVADVFRAGYLMHDRVIRPAMVQVAKKKSA